MPIERMDLPAPYRLLRSHGNGGRRRWVLVRLGANGMTPIREWTTMPARAEVIGAVTENGGLRCASS